MSKVRRCCETNAIGVPPEADRAAEIPDTTTLLRRSTPRALEVLAYLLRCGAYIGLFEVVVFALWVLLCNAISRLILYEIPDKKREAGSS